MEFPQFHDETLQQTLKEIKEIEDDLEKREKQLESKAQELFQQPTNEFETLARDYHVCVQMQEEKLRLATILSEQAEKQYQQTIKNIQKLPQKEQTYCICNQPQGELQMIGCDGEDCKYEWFHLDCLKLKKIPKGKWLCSFCIY